MKQVEGMRLSIRGVPGFFFRVLDVFCESQAFMDNAATSPKLKKGDQFKRTACGHI